MYLLNSSDSEDSLKIRVVRPKQFHSQPEDKLTKHLLVYGLKINHIVHRQDLHARIPGLIHQRTKDQAAPQCASPETNVDPVNAAGGNSSSSGVSSWSTVTEGNSQLGHQVTSSNSAALDSDHLHGSIPMKSHPSSQPVPEIVSVHEFSDYQQHLTSPSLQSITNTSIINMCCSVENVAIWATKQAVVQEEFASVECGDQRQWQQVTSFSNTDNSAANICCPAENMTSCGTTSSTSSEVHIPKVSPQFQTDNFQQPCPSAENITSCGTTSMTSSEVHIAEVSPQLQTDEFQQHCPSPENLTSCGTTSPTSSEVHISEVSPQFQTDNLQQHCPSAENITSCRATSMTSSDVHISEVSPQLQTDEFQQHCPSLENLTSCGTTSPTSSEVHMSEVSPQFQTDNFQQHCPSVNGFVLALLRRSTFATQAGRRCIARLVRAAVPSRARLTQIQRLLRSLVSTCCCCCCCSTCT